VGVSLNNTPAASFQFDPAGNLVSLTTGNTTTGFTYNSLNQRTTPGVNVYDAKGQTTDKDGRTFEWDDDGRMTAIVDGTSRSEFAYDGLGRRYKITELTDGAITSKKLYWWLGGKIVCERDGNTVNNPITKRYFGQGVVVGGNKLFYTFDQLGSVRELIDSTGSVRADYRYDTYGKRTRDAGDLDSDFGYAGLFHHEPSGLDLATYRTYDSSQGRWISRDPLGEGVDYNLYRYCGNNPISGIDPQGLYLVVTFQRLSDLQGFLSRAGLNLRSGRFTGRGRFEVDKNTCTTATGRLRDIIEHDNPITFDLDSADFVGALTSTSVQTIDLGDLSVLEAAGVTDILINGLFQHEVDEAYRAQTGDLTLSAAAAWNTHHPGALDAENTAIGPTWHREADGTNTLNYTENTPGGPVHHSLEIRGVGPLQVNWR